MQRSNAVVFLLNMSLIFSCFLDRLGKTWKTPWWTCNGTARCCPFLRVVFAGTYKISRSKSRGVTLEVHGMHLQFDFILSWQTNAHLRVLTCFWLIGQEAARLTKLLRTNIQCVVHAVDVQYIHI